MERTTKANTLIASLVALILFAGISGTVGAVSLGIVTQPSAAIDSGQNVILANLTSGGTGPYTYQWYNSSAADNSIACGSASVMSASTSNTLSTGPLTSNTGYCLQVTDNGASGATAAANVIVVVNAAPTLLLSPSSETIEAGQSVAFTNVTSGGTPPYSYSYSVNNGTLGIDYTISGNSITFLTPNTYVVTESATDSANSVAAANAVITVNSTPAIFLTASASAVDVGSTVTISNVVSGGIPPYNSYPYSVNQLSGVTISGNGITFNSIGVYLVTENAIDSSGAVATNQIQITVNEIPTISNFSPVNPTVEEQKSIAFSANIVGGTGPFAYNFFVFNATTGDSISNGIAASGSVVTFDNSGIFNVTVGIADAYGYHNTSANIIVNVVADPAVSISAPALQIFTGQSDVLSAVISGGIGPFTYNWYNYTGTNPIAIPNATGASYTVDGNKVGTFTYYVSVLDSNGFSNQSANVTINVGQQAPPPPSFSGGSVIGGGASGGGGGPGGGSTFVPTVQRTNSSCITIYNFSRDNEENFTIGNSSFQIVENFISPSAAGVSLNGNTYLLNPNQTVNASDGYYLDLENVSYLPIEHTITVDLCYLPPQLSTNEPPSTTVPQAPGTTVQVAVAANSTQSGSAAANQSNANGNTTGAGGSGQEGLSQPGSRSQLLSELAPAAVGILIALILFMLAYKSGKLNRSKQPIQEQNNTRARPRSRRTRR